MLQRISLLLVLCLLTPPATANAQLLSRIFGRSNSACPGGVCPTGSAQWHNVDGLSARQHLEHVHHTDTSGMSAYDIQQEQNAYHNTYGSGHPVRGAVRAVVSVPRAGVRAVARAATYPARAVAATYGSSGSAARASYGSTGSSAMGYGSSGSSLQVGQPDVDGFIVTEIYPPSPVPTLATPYRLEPIGQAAYQACPCNCPNCTCPKGVAEVSALGDVSALRIGDRARLMKVMLTAARQARGNAPLNDETIARMKAAMADAALDDLSMSTQAIDIDKWIELIEKLIPIIIKLIGLFGQNDVILNNMQYAYDDSALYDLAI